MKVYNSAHYDLKIFPAGLDFLTSDIMDLRGEKPNYLKLNYQKKINEDYCLYYKNGSILILANNHHLLSMKTNDESYASTSLISVHLKFQS